MAKQVICKRAFGVAELFDGSFESASRIIEMYKTTLNIDMFLCDMRTQYRRERYLVSKDGDEVKLIKGEWYILDQYGLRTYPETSEPVHGLPKQYTIHDLFEILD